MNATHEGQDAAACPKCKGTGHDYTQRHQSLHGCFAHFNTSVCWSCAGTGRAQQAAPVAEMDMYAELES